MMYDLREEIFTVTFFVLGRKPAKRRVNFKAIYNGIYMQYGLAS